MRHKLTGYVYVDNLNIKVGTETNHSMTYFAQPLVYKEVVAGCSKNKVVKNMG
jgi:hypothetical protein